MRSSGQLPYIIHLSEAYPPLGALGYVDAAKELLNQNNEFDVFVVASSIGATHAGLLLGLRGSRSKAVVIDCCVRRASALQGPIIDRMLERLTAMYISANNVIRQDIRVLDGALAPGYRRIGRNKAHGITRGFVS